MKPHDIFEANDLFENTNHTQVQSTLLALASMVSVGDGWAPWLGMWVELLVPRPLRGTPTPVPAWVGEGKPVPFRVFSATVWLRVSPWPSPPHPGQDEREQGERGSEIRGEAGTEV